MSLKSDFLNEIETRGFIYQSSDIEEFDNIASNNKVTGYIGFDITSDSLHIGSLVKRFKNLGTYSSSMFLQN